MKINIGDTVRDKKEGTLGKVVWSSFGASVTGFINDIHPDTGEQVRIHFQTIGQPIKNLEEHWEVVK